MADPWTDAPDEAPTAATEKVPHGPLPEQPARFGAVQLVAVGMINDEPVLASLGHHLLRDLARNHKRVLAGEVVETQRLPVVFVPFADGAQPVELGSVLDTTGRTEPDAYMLAWETDTVPRAGDPDPLIGALSDDGVSRGVLPEPDQIVGGQVNFRHGIDGEATIRAYRRDGTPINYLFAVEIDAGEHQVEVLPGTATLTAEPDADDDDPAPDGDPDE